MNEGFIFFTIWDVPKCIKTEVGWFYSISTIVGYLRPNSVYAYILDLYDLSKNCYVLLMIQLNISHLFTDS